MPMKKKKVNLFNLLFKNRAGVFCGFLWLLSSLEIQR